MKTIKYFVMAAFVAIAGMAVTSCGGGDGYSNDKAKEMIIKSDDGKLTEEDYTQMVQWLNEAQTDALDTWEKVINDNAEYKDYYFAKSEAMHEHDGKFLYIDEISAIITQDLNTKTFGEANKDQLEKQNEAAQKRSQALLKKVPEKK